MYVKFYISTGYVNSGKQEVIEFDDDATDEEIDESYREWVFENCDCEWFKLE